MSLADLPRYEMRRVSTLGQLCELLHEHRGDEAPVVMLAGGTDVLPEISQASLRAGPLPLVVDVSTMAELRGITWDGDQLRVGAATTYREIQRHDVVRERLPLLARMTRDLGGPTIQARGTLGGNIATASPAADGMAALGALDAVIEVRSVRGSRRIAFKALQTGYKQSTRERDEVIVAAEIAPPPLGSPWMWRKVGTRRAQSISKVALAAVAELDDGKITRFGAALASVAPVTAMLPNSRKLMAGARPAELDGAALDAAVESDISPITDLRSTAAYRRHCAKALVRAFARQLGAPL